MKVPTCGIETISGPEPRRYSYGQTQRSERNIELLAARFLDRFLVARIRMPHDAQRGVVPQYARDALRRGVRSIAHDDDARVLRVAHPHAAAMMNRDPRR